MSVDMFMNLDSLDSESTATVDTGELDVMVWARGTASPSARIAAQSDVDAPTLSFTKFFESISAGRLRADTLPPLPTGLDQCREQLPCALDSVAERFSVEAWKSPSAQAFQPAFSPSDWRTFGSFCITRRLPADARVVSAGCTDRALRFVVEGSLSQSSATSTRTGAGLPNPLLPGDMIGEDAVFSDAPGELDVRTLEDTLILELPRSRHNELAASHPAIAFELMRAAGAIIANRVTRQPDPMAAPMRRATLSAAGAAQLQAI